MNMIYGFMKKIEIKNRLLESTILVDMFFNIKQESNTYFYFNKLTNIEIKETLKI